LLNLLPDQTLLNEPLSQFKLRLLFSSSSAPVGSRISRFDLQKPPLSPDITERNDLAIYDSHDAIKDFAGSQKTEGRKQEKQDDQEFAETKHIET
jgi:hypothetical protein